MIVREELRIVTGNANRPLAEEIATYLGEKLTDCMVTRFSDGEVFVQINDNIRGADVFIIQPTNAPAENLMELLMLIEASRRASAMRITAVIPYYGYARQDRKDRPRVAITATPVRFRAFSIFLTITCTPRHCSTITFGKWISRICA